MSGGLLVAVFVFAALYSGGSAIGSYISYRTLQELGTPPAPIGVTQSGGRGKRKSPRKDYDVLVKQNYFSVDADKAAPARPKPVSRSTESQITISSIPAILIGTLAGGIDNPLAIIQDTRNRSVDIYGVGDRLLNMAEVKRIERMRVLVERNGKIEEIVLSEDNEAPKGKKGKRNKKAVKASKKKTPSLDVVENGENEFVIDKEQFSDLLTDLGPLLSSARVVPNFEGGVIDGYKIFAIRSNSLYEKIGLQNGDIIDAINGNKIETPDKALMLFQQLKSEEHFDLSIRRDGSALSFSYDLE